MSSRRSHAPVASAAEGRLIVVPDPKRRSGRLLVDDGMQSSYIDLANDRHLEFEYMRWMRIVLRAAGARRVLHLGGGACALGRALAAEDPDGRQDVCEIDADVLELARAHLGLRRMPGLRVRHADGRAHLESQADDSWDAVVIDAFIGAREPVALTSLEALGHAARVAPLTLINVVDDRTGQELASIAAAVAANYRCAWALGAEAGRGNTVVVGAHELADLDRIAAAGAADPAPPRVFSPARLSQLAAGAAPRRDR